MVKVSPWSVKGIEPDVRELAKDAAKQAGMTLGQWLNRTIRSAASQQAVTLSVAPADTAKPSISNEAGAAGEIGISNLGESAAAAPSPEGETVDRAPTNHASIFDILLNPASQTDRFQQKRTQDTARPIEQPAPSKGAPESPITQKISPPAAMESALQRLSEKLEKTEAARQAVAAEQRPVLFSRAR